MENLRKLRQSRNIKQQEVARYLNISRGSYSRYETGDRNPDPDTLKKLSEFFSVSIDYLVGTTNSTLTPEEIEFIDSYKKKSTEALLKEFDLHDAGNPLTEDQQREIIHLLKSASFEELEKMLKVLHAMRGE